MARDRCIFKKVETEKTKKERRHRKCGKGTGDVGGKSLSAAVSEHHGAGIKKRGISYRDFAPVCIDEEKPELLLMEEDIVTVLHELERDLNALTILTERPDFFSSYAARMEEEYGLMVSVREKRHAGGESPFLFPGNVILDFERNGHFCTPEKTGGYCYIPIYKIPWQSGENLDILVPIGYNTVIVKGLDLREESGSSKDVFAGFSEQ